LKTERRDRERNIFSQKDSTSNNTPNCSQSIPIKNKTKLNQNQQKKKKLLFKRKGEICTYKINDKAAIGAAASGLPEVGHAIGTLGSGKDVGDAIHYQIPSIN
jgi:hypothetical protein